MQTYNLTLRRTVERVIKKYDPQLVRELHKKHFPKILSAPRKAGRPLSGGLKGFWSYHFRHSGTQYRVVYDIMDDLVMIVVFEIGKRDTVYTRAQKRI